MENKVVLKAMGITVVVMVLVYRSIWGILLFPAILWVLQKDAKQKEREKGQTKLQEEFLHGIGILNSALQAGLSMENAWIEVEKETKLLYGSKSSFYMAIKEINQKVAHNNSIEKLFLEYAYRSKLEDMMQFAELLEFGKRSGSNWKKIIEGTVAQMTERQETKQQIEVMVAEKKMEQQIMNILPVGLLGFLQISAWDYMSILYHNILGCIVMTIFLLGYVVAIRFSEKILQVEL